MNVLIVEPNEKLRARISDGVASLQPNSSIEMGAGADDACEFLAEGKVNVLFIGSGIPESAWQRLLSVAQRQQVRVIGVDCSRDFQPGVCMIALNDMKPGRLVGFLQSTLIETWDPPDSRLDDDSMAEEEFKETRKLGTRSHLLVCDQGRCWFLDVRSIVAFESYGSYTLVHSCDGRKPMVSRTLTAVHRVPEIQRFFRASRKYLISLDHIEALERNGSGSMVATMPLIGRIYFSRRQTKVFRSHYEI